GCATCSGGPTIDYATLRTRKWAKSGMRRFNAAFRRLPIAVTSTLSNGDFGRHASNSFSSYVDCGAFPPLLFFVFLLAACKEIKKQKRRENAAVQIVPRETFNSSCNNCVTMSL